GIPKNDSAFIGRALGLAETVGLHLQQGNQDPVMLALSQALLPALAMPESAHRMFLDQLHLAILSHLLQRYGTVEARPMLQRLLSARQEAMAKDFIRAHHNQDFSLAELAAVCGLSRSYFIRAFRQTVGVTPYRWLMEYKIGRAKELLLGDQTIAEIAAELGFADQSHMGRSFVRAVGLPPSLWRKLYKN
ncbi:AraC family transcriptional regulator, partial [Allorhizobium sp. BGMRC 0089]|uniref:helix-turn-helix domain-containing protein n=1 Tax=Allorhizobium sonneratiae TaxID=2934936 RepID=UPI002033E86B